MKLIVKKVMSHYKKKVTTGVTMLMIILLLCSCGNIPSVNHVQSSSSLQNDFSDQTQEYFEYIGTYLKKGSGLSKHDDTQEWIIEELRQAGYSDEQITLQKIEGKSGKNIVVKAEGTDSEKSIIVGAHYDGEGVGDNGSGVALLLAAACGLSKEILPVTTYYVFFDEEESGGYGSESFADSLSDEMVNSTVYMINIDAIAFGDYCNIYGGKQDSLTKDISKTEGYEYASELARKLGFNVYGTKELEGYFEEHGEGVALDPNGLFTNPWTKEHPAPENTVSDELHSYSPTTIPMSDHVPFIDRGITYIYFEATNWYIKTDYEEIAYIGYTDVGDESVGDGGFIMNTKYDTLETMNTYYPGRSLEHFRLYSPLLSELILNPYSD